MSPHAPARSHRRVLQAVALAMLFVPASVAASAQQPPAPPPEVPLAQQLIGAGKFDSALRVIEPLVKASPQNGQAWVLLGQAHRGLGHYDAASESFQKALAVPAARRRAAQLLFLMAADSGRRGDAARWLPQVRTSGIDFSTLVGNREVERLRGDARFAELFPGKGDFDRPFEERVRIIHEWRGDSAGAEFGWIARGIGDADGDGVADVTVSAPAHPPFGSGRGEVYVYYGRKGNAVGRRVGEQGALLVTSCEAAGDVNADGTPDVVAGAPGINAVLVFSGRDGRELLRIPGDSVDQGLGVSAGGVGDFNGDGHADIVAGAPQSGAAGAAAGRAYVFSGKDGTRLLALDGEQPGDGFGSSASGGRGRYIIVGAGGGGPQRTGRVYVYDRLDAKPKFVLNADETGRGFGSMFVSVIGDANADGTPDVYVSDYPNAAKGPATGRAYVFSGKDGAGLLALTGDTAGVGFGVGAAHTGDVNRDGHDDLVLGAWQHSTKAWSGGQILVISGKDGAVLRRITGRVPGETLGFDAVGIGDADGDGATDYLVTSAWSLVNGFRSGRTFVIAGERMR